MTDLMKYHKSCPFLGNFQSLIILNLDFAGNFSSSVTPWLTYSNIYFMKLHLSNWKLAWHVWNTLHTHSRYTSMASKLLQNINISLIIVMLPETSFLSRTKNSSVYITVTCLLIRVPKFRKVSINVIYYSS